jgi:uncharacterized cofD-like protein
MIKGPTNGLRIVSIGGGTGLGTLLSGLKIYVGVHDPELDQIESLSAVVTVTDDGGSSGRLREEFQILPPGDIRNCLVALAEDEHLLTKLFQYRFESDGDLSGHSFGNIFLAALAEVTGDFLEAIKATSEVLAIKGRIFPSTTEDVTLVAELEDGRLIEGETKIVESRSRIKNLRLSKADCHPLPETLEAIEKADLITIGPGSLYTSIIPNLLVTGIVDAINDSKALKIYICNIMTQPGETDGFTIEDHIAALVEYSPQLTFDYVVANSAPVHPPLLEKYLAEGAVQVKFGTDIQSPVAGVQRVTIDVGKDGRKVSVICADLLSETLLVRHDPGKLARLVLDVNRAEENTALGVVHNS